ncbi:hypothetical protein Tco_0718203 [Tanacetum coccineum]
MEEVAVREAGAAGLQSLEHLIGLLSTHHHDVVQGPCKIPTRTHFTKSNSNTEKVNVESGTISGKYSGDTSGNGGYGEGVVPASYSAKGGEIWARLREKRCLRRATINFAELRLVGYSATSFIWSLTGDTDGLQPFDVIRGFR